MARVRRPRSRTAQALHVHRTCTAHGHRILDMAHAVAWLEMMTTLPVGFLMRPCLSSAAVTRSGPTAHTSIYFSCSAGDRLASVSSCQRHKGRQPGCTGCSLDTRGRSLCMTHAAFPAPRSSPRCSPSHQRCRRPRAPPPSRPPARRSERPRPAPPPPPSSPAVRTDRYGHMHRHAHACTRCCALSTPRARLQLLANLTDDYNNVGPLRAQLFGEGEAEPLVASSDEHTLACRMHVINAVTRTRPTPLQCAGGRPRHPGAAGARLRSARAAWAISCAS